MANWYVMENQQKVGPLVDGQVEQMVQMGRVRPDTLVWRDGMSQWVAAGTVQDLPGGAAFAGTAPAPQAGYAQPGYPPQGYAPQGYAPVAYAGNPNAKSKMAAGLLGIFVGAWGVHRFYLGFTGLGIAQIAVTLVTCGLGGLWGFIEGIMILTGSINTDASGMPLKD